RRDILERPHPGGAACVVEDVIVGEVDEVDVAGGVDGQRDRRAAAVIDGMRDLLQRPDAAHALGVDDGLVGRVDVADVGVAGGVEDERRLVRAAAPDGRVDALDLEAAATAGAAGFEAGVAGDAAGAGAAGGVAVGRCRADLTAGATARRAVRGADVRADVRPRGAGAAVPGQRAGLAGDARAVTLAAGRALPRGEVAVHLRRAAARGARRAGIGRRRHVAGRVQRSR